MIDAEKAFDKIQHLVLLNVMKEVSIEWTYLNILKFIYYRPITNIY